MCGTTKVGMLWVLVNVKSKKQCEELESMSVQIRIDNEGVFTRAAALSQTNFAMWSRSMQPSACIG